MAPPRAVPTSAPAPQDPLETYHQHRGLLFSIAYRMLGSVSDVEDILQETFIRWQQTSWDQIQSPKALLVTIVTRLCLNHLQSARVKREEYFGEWLPEPLLTSAFDPDMARIDGSISMAFMVLLERLNPAERAVFLLREIFDYEYPEIAAILGQSETNCRQILRRARQHVKKLEPRFDASPRQHEKLLKEFLDASSKGDMGGLVSLLSDDVVFHSDSGGKVAAVPNRVVGADRVVRLMLGALRKLVPANRVNRFAQINGQLGIVSYLDEKPFSVLTLDVFKGRIRGIYVVNNPDKLARIPLLAALPPAG
jgi:RNA polymerase sigma-70 factor, ECF subfamily